MLGLRGALEQGWRGGQVLCSARELVMEVGTAELRTSDSVGLDDVVRDHSPQGSHGKDELRGQYRGGKSGSGERALRALGGQASSAAGAQQPQRGPFDLTPSPSTGVSTSDRGLRRQNPLALGDAAEGAAPSMSWASVVA